MSRNRTLEAASLIQGSETDTAIIPSYSINQAISEPGERARPTPSIKSVKKFGEHDIELAHILRLRLNSSPALSGCIKISTFTELLSFSFDLGKYPLLGWYLNNLGIFLLLDP